MTTAGKGNYRKKPEFNEKRQFSRLKKAITVQYKVKDLPQAGADMSQAKDLSEEGISFTISNPLAAQTILDIGLRIPGLEDLLNLEGEVVSCKEIRLNVVYAVGVKFINLSEKHKELLRSFIQSLLEE